jgi:hypothetical protein
VTVFSFGDSVRGRESEGLKGFLSLEEREDGAKVLAEAPSASKFLSEQVVRGNLVAIDRVCSVEPIVVDVAKALDVVPGMRRDLLLHAGPPISYERACGPLRRALGGALVFEGLAATLDEAEQLLASGRVKLSPCHHHDAVGPMTGVISPSMPVLVTEDRNSGKRAYSTFNEGGGNALWLGVFERDTLERLCWIRDILAPVLKAVFKAAGGVPVWTILAQGLQMGDECHNRHAASTNIFLKSITEHLFLASLPRDTALAAYRYISGNSHFFLNMTMSACKLAMDAANDVPYSTMVTAMARNGTDFGIRVSALGGKWFIAPAPHLKDALYNPGYGPDDGAPDIGDSAIIETMGLGGFVIAAAPAMAAIAGGGLEQALSISRRMGLITLAKNVRFPIPTLDFEGSPMGIDVRRVIDSGIVPSIDSAVVHKQGGIGQIGVGIARAPYECFGAALEAFVSKVDRRS